MTVRRTFWILSIANWLLAVAVWSVSAYLGIARPTSLFIPTTLFVVGIFAVLAGTLCWVVARFGRPPDAAVDTAGAREPAGAGPVAPAGETAATVEEPASAEAG
jgi:hypothetical protein